ncbi:MAG: lmo0937 family membrane protein [Pyrinomonadaceae bacterium]
MNWIVALAIFVLWLTLWLIGKGGFIHMLLLTAVAIAVVQWVADRRAAQG